MQTVRLLTSSVASRPGDSQKRRVRPTYCVDCASGVLVRLFTDVTWGPELWVTCATSPRAHSIRD